MKQPAGTHPEPSLQSDIDLIVKCLQTQHVFHPGTVARQHFSFPKFSNDPFLTFRRNPKKLHEWLKTKRKQLSVEQLIQERNL